MKMSDKAVELYENLNKLLDDICKFLSEEKNLGTAAAKKHAYQLIKRSEQQLKEISKLTEASENDGAYMDMDKKPALDVVEATEEDDQSNIYSAITEAPKNKPEVEESNNPIIDLPAKSIQHPVKVGYLFRKVKLFLNFEKHKRIFCVIYQNWFLVYPSKKSREPIYTFDLETHRARPVHSKGKLPQDFEIFPIHQDKVGVLHISAPSNDVMLQWVFEINKKPQLGFMNSISPINSQMHFTPTISLVGSHMQNGGYKENNEDEEEIYHEVIMSPTREDTKTLDQPPDLPSRKPRTFTTPLGKDTDSCQEYDPVEPTLVPSSPYEDDVYEMYVTEPDSRKIEEVALSPPKLCR